MPASRSARATILAPRSWPSRPGLATRTRMGLAVITKSGVHNDAFTKAANQRLPAWINSDHQPILIEMPVLHTSQRPFADFTERRIRPNAIQNEGHQVLICPGCVSQRL